MPTQTSVQTDTRICGKCGKKLTGVAHDLELRFTDNTWHKPGTVPEEDSQGTFEFGPCCSKKILANGGAFDFEMLE